METFSKSAQTPAALMETLAARKLIVATPKLAEQYISFVGHYRLKGYWFQFIDPVTKEFKAGTTFEMIRNRYEFDREIRCLILEGIERLEAAMRTVLCNFLSLRHTPHWFLDTSLFKPGRKFSVGQMLSKIEREVARASDKRFIKAYYDEYDDPYLPPSWAMCECVTLGIWSRTYQMLRDAGEKKSVSAKFGVGQVEVFESWLHTLTVLRNMAAHHNQFLGQKLGVGPMNLKAKGIRFTDNKSVYSGLTVVHLLRDSMGFNTTFRQSLIDLKQRYGWELMRELGFPDNWPARAVGW